MFSAQEKFSLLLILEIVDVPSPAPTWSESEYSLMARATMPLAMALTVVGEFRSGRDQALLF